MDLWQMLSETSRPILLYGMGNGADKIINELKKRGITPAGFFASDGFVRGHVFHGKTVMAASEALSSYPDAIVLLAFGSARSEVLLAIDKIRQTHTLLVPDVPVFGNQLFDEDFYQTHQQQFSSARALLADERSRQLFDDIIRFKLSGNPDYLRDTQSIEQTISECLHPTEYQYCLDLGAYTGDTAAMMAELFPHLISVTAWEPDPKTFSKLLRFAQNNPYVKPMHLASLDYTGTVDFAVSGNRNAGIDAPGKLAPIPCSTVDEASIGTHIDFIKIDVEGAEHRTLAGCTQTIKEHRPDLLLSLYHRSKDLFDLPLYLHNLCPDYRMYLRRDKGLPAWDILLAATCR
ncbi:MAG: FkbM family methyltransferase [Ruminococcaceae bacterium]|nr:FkbM family methyltransferase [Oscillospiraceae bacterium]